jgi:hypothetical protein
MIPQRGHDHDGHQIAPFQRGGRQTGAAQCSQRVLAMPARRGTELIEHPPLLTPRPRSVAFRHRRPPRFNRIGSTRDDSATVRAKFLSTHRRLLWMDVGCRSRIAEFAADVHESPRLPADRASPGDVAVLHRGLPRSDNSASSDRAWRCCRLGHSALLHRHDANCPRMAART